MCKHAGVSVVRCAPVIAAGSDPPGWGKIPLTYESPARSTPYWRLSQSCGPRVVGPLQKAVPNADHFLDARVVADSLCVGVDR